MSVRDERDCGHGKIHLICLPFAGGTSFAYRTFGKHLCEDVVVRPVELPGHGSLFGKPQLQTLDAMTEFVFAQVRDIITSGPYAIFGHSMGGMLAYLLARKIRDERLPAPLHLFISARRPGTVTPPFFWTDLSRDAFLERISALGGIPKEVLANRELMEIFEPILYNDVKALETHVHDEIAPLLTPLTVFLGEDDDIPVEDALHWCRETIGPVRVEVFAGGHFFAFERAEELGQKIDSILDEQWRSRQAYVSAAARLFASTAGTADKGDTDGAAD